MRLGFLFFCLPLCADLIDLQDLSQDFVLETKQIEISGCPYAFNPSMVRWHGYILMSFRFIPDPTSPFTSWIGLVLLDEQFNPVGEPQLLNIRDGTTNVPSRADDARLLYVGDKLMIVYSDNPNPKITGGGFRMMIGELHFTNGSFALQNAVRLVEYEGEKETLRENNWTPFEYRSSLFLSYSIDPHRVFFPIPGKGTCITYATTFPSLHWEWGILRGGTPALMLESGEYFAFFHSAKKMATQNSQGKTMTHYYMGAYTFEPEPPFRITRFSKEPIVGPGFYKGRSYKPYWGSIQCVFPAGMIMEGNTIWLSYGRQDHEIWIAKIDKKKLLDSLETFHN